MPTDTACVLQDKMLDSKTFFIMLQKRISFYKYKGDLVIHFFYDLYKTVLDYDKNDSGGWKFTSDSY